MRTKSNANSNKKSESIAHLYSNVDLRKLLIPIIVEQLLSSLMGTVDTMMVSNVGSAALSAVSLVDSINILVIQALSALAAGGAILCSQYLGSHNEKGANNAARQVLYVMALLLHYRSSASCSATRCCARSSVPWKRMSCAIHRSTSCSRCFLSRSSAFMMPVLRSCVRKTTAAPR